MIDQEMIQENNFQSKNGLTINFVDNFINVNKLDNIEVNRLL